MPFLLAEILNFQGSTHRIGVGSFSKLVELMFLYSYDASILTDAEKNKMSKELESKWDYHESDLMEVCEKRILDIDL